MKSLQVSHQNVYKGFEVDGHVIESAPHLPISPSDNRCSHDQHLNGARERAIKAIFALSRIMLNIGGPRYTKRKLLTSVASSIVRGR